MTGLLIPLTPLPLSHQVILKDKEKRLSVMKDSSAAAGVTAIIFILLLKYSALKNLSHFCRLLLFIIASYAGIFKVGNGCVNAHGKAGKDGLGKIFMNKTGFRDCNFYFASYSDININTDALKPLCSWESTCFYAILFGVLYSFCRISVYFFNKKLAG